jgi:uncharacterized membrane protein
MRLVNSRISRGKWLVCEGSLVGAVKPNHCPRASAGRETAMRSAKVILAVLLCSSAMLFVAGGEARSQTFDYVFCNKTRIKVLVAVATLVSPGDKRFKVEGWWTIPAEQCANIGAFPKGWAYYYAEQDDPGTARWEADDVGICVEYPTLAARPIRKSKESRASSSTPIPA